jgi:septum site-determining protein MinD
MLSVEDILELLAVDLIGLVPDDENVMINTNRGIPVIMDRKSIAGQAFRNIALRLTGTHIPFMDLEDQGGLLGRLKRIIRP